MLCALILHISGGTDSLKSTTNDRFLRSFSWQFYLLSKFLREICWETVAKEIFAYFRFNIWSGVWTRALLLISQYTTYCTTENRSFLFFFFFCLFFFELNFSSSLKQILTFSVHHRKSKYDSNVSNFLDFVNLYNFLQLHMILLSTSLTKFKCKVITLSGYQKINCYQTFFSTLNIFKF